VSEEYRKELSKRFEPFSSFVMDLESTSLKPLVSFTLLALQLIDDKPVIRLNVRCHFAIITDSGLFEKWFNLPSFMDCDFRFRKEVQKN
jgi:hypothetical protein